METVEIQIDQRKPGSKQEARRLRREGKLPGVFYGPKAAAVPLSLDKKEFLNRFGSLEGSHLINLNFNCFHRNLPPKLDIKNYLVRQIKS